ncbi:hypothetical protein BH11MYX4_BH11MYX4_44270 [soil metagenome]
MSRTAKTRAAVAPKQRTVSGARQGVRGSSPPRARQSLSDLAKAIRTGLAATERSAAHRDAGSELERYERAIVRWASVPPSEAQSAAMLEQLLALQERVQRLPSKNPIKATTTTTKLPRTAAPRMSTTTKLPRTTPSRPPRPREG